MHLTHFSNRASVLECLNVSQTILETESSYFAPKTFPSIPRLLALAAHLVAGVVEHVLVAQRGMVQHLAVRQELRRQ